MTDMEAFFPALDFLSEYPLRYVERTKRDSLQRITHYEYKDLMGDHPLVPLSKAITDDPELEAQVSTLLIDPTNSISCDHFLRAVNAQNAETGQRSILTDLRAQKAAVS